MVYYKNFDLFFSFFSLHFVFVFLKSGIKLLICRISPFLDRLKQDGLTMCRRPFTFMTDHYRCLSSWRRSSGHKIIDIKWPVILKSSLGEWPTFVQVQIWDYWLVEYASKHWEKRVIDWGYLALNQVLDINIESVGPAINYIFITDSKYFWY